MKKKDISLIIVTISILLLTSKNLFNYLTVLKDLKYANFPGFWDFMLHRKSGDYIVILSSVLISIISSNYLNNILNSSIFKNEISRVGYKNTVKNIYKNTIKKCSKPFVLLNIFVFLIGVIFLSKTYTGSISDYYFHSEIINNLGNANPYIFMLLNTITTFMLIIVITNISIIAFKITRKVVPSIILSFIMTNAFNLLIYVSASLIAKILNNGFTKYAETINLYEGYIIQSNIYNAIFNTFIYLIVSFIPLLIIYHNKKWTELE